MMERASAERVSMEGTYHTDPAGSKESPSAIQDCVLVYSKRTPSQTNFPMDFDRRDSAIAASEL